MPAQQQHWMRTAFLSGATGPVAIGQALVSNGTRFVVATSANRTLYGRAVCIAISAGDDDDTSIETQAAGFVPEDVTGLGAGSASWIRVSTTGTLERCTPADGDDLVGRCNARGDLVNFQPGTWDSDNHAGGGGGNPHRVKASDYAGADIGAQINAAADAMTALGGGVVEVEDGDYALTTRVVIEEGVTVMLGTGTISNALLATDIPLFLLKDNASLIGKGFGSKIMTPKRVGAEYFAVAVGDYNSWPDNTQQGNQNLLVKDIQFIFNSGSSAFDSQSGAVQFGSVRNCRVEGCLFKGVEGYGCFQVSASNNGYYADGFHIVDCIFEDVSTQHAGVINARNWSIRGCTFRPTASTAGPTLIDCELNTPTDIIENGIIADNIFDISSIGAGSGGALLQLVGGGTAYDQTGRPRKVLISNNVVRSGDTSTVCFTYGISVANSDHVIVSNNSVQFSQYCIILSASNSCTVDGNSVHGGGNLSANPILIGNCLDCYVTNNKVFDNTAGAWSIPSIAEATSAPLESDYNVFSNNTLSVYPELATTANGDCRIDLVGAHSRVFNTYTGTQPTPTDAPVTVNLTELENLPIPGTRDVDAPAVTLVGGHAAQADGGFAPWKYVAASTRAPNGMTVITPASNAGNGRWERGSQWIKLDTATRDALSLTSDDEGFTIWNTDDKELNTWNGTDWGGGVAPLDPATLAAELYWVKGAYAAGTWSGTASSGGSGGRDAVAGTAPAAASAAPDYDGTDDYLVNATAVSSLITAAAGTIIVIGKADAAEAADNTTPVNNPCLFGENQGALGISFSDAGVRAILHDGAYKFVTIAQATGSFFFAAMRWDGALLELSLDGGVTWSSTAAGNLSIAAGTVQLGVDFSGAGQFFDGIQNLCLAFQSKLSDGNVQGIYAYATAQGWMT